MSAVGLDTTRRVEYVYTVPLGASVLRLLVPGAAAGVCIDGHYVADWVEVTSGVIQTMRELFSKDEGDEF
jgi:hypothetical protein